MKPAHYSDCVIGLIKALEGYIRANDELRLEMLRHGEMTVAEAKKDAMEGQRYVEMLDDLRAFHEEAEVLFAMVEKEGRALS